MDRELEKKLADRFPSFFRNLRTNRMMFGIEHDAGWFDIIWRMCERIEEYVKDRPELDFRFAQIKEKFASLRVYFEGGDDTLYEIIEGYEKESETTCEDCGSREDTMPYSSTGWWKTRCLKCWDAFADKNKRPRFAAEVLAEARGKGEVTLDTMLNLYWSKKRQEPPATT